jgi:hypothetical protein
MAEMYCHACDSTGRANGHPLRSHLPDGVCADCGGLGRHQHVNGDVFREMWRRKAAREDHFAHARLTRDVAVLLNHSVAGDMRTRTIPAGTRVLCTIVSRFGDIGIRDTQIDRIAHGYDARVFPAALSEVVLVTGGRRV